VCGDGRPARHPSENGLGLLPLGPDPVHRGTSPTDVRHRTPRRSSDPARVAEGSGAPATSRPRDLASTRPRVHASTRPRDHATTRPRDLASPSGTGGPGRPGSAAPAGAPAPSRGSPGARGPSRTIRDRGGPDRTAEEAGRGAPGTRRAAGDTAVHGPGPHVSGPSPVGTPPTQRAARVAFAVLFLSFVDLCRPWDYADTSVGEAAEGAVRHHVAGIWPGSGARRSA
jgi:hypothetical protein